jgi:hypothetical protein
MKRRLGFGVLALGGVLVLGLFAVQQRARSDQSQGEPSQTSVDRGGLQTDQRQQPAGKAMCGDTQTGSTHGDMNMSAGMDMGDDMDASMHAHMHMTDLRPENAADERRAEDILRALRPAISKYIDYKVALADGFRIFYPNVPQKVYHFTNYRYALAEQFRFDPAYPTSLLYRKVGDGYELVGAMYTAPRRFTEQQLNDRVPLSVARWHEHVNFCLPPRGTPVREADWTRFGVGSIATEDACSAAGGRWVPQVFGWMVHVYPFQSDPNKLWAR